jgi:hypothetical protein
MFYRVCSYIGPSPTRYSVRQRGRMTHFSYPNRQLPAAQCAQCPVPTAQCSVRAVHCSLLTAHCSVLSAQCSVLTAHCSLLTAQCSVLSAQCSLLTAHRKLSVVPQIAKSLLRITDPRQRTPCRRNPNAAKSPNQQQKKELNG